ncbi:MAG: polysaccharide pyruvyl transferase family protein [Clostridia bacterium]|jgi:hypothetical protein|nr:polysaccharide pyruvyl transferase family protein [Clostridia bacterium]
MKKKIGILTFHNTINYGGVLQCFALQSFLTELGYYVEVINYDSANIREHNQLIQKKGRRNILKSIALLPWNMKRKINYQSFIKREFKLSKKITKQELSEFCNQSYDYIVVGSDQVWNREIIQGEEEVYYLDNVKTPKISYAASIGSNSKENLELLTKSVSNFKKLSIREQSTIDILEKEYQIFAEANMDPTLLLTREKWEKLLNIHTENENELLLYILDNNSNLNTIVEELKKTFSVEEIKTFSKKKFGIKEAKSLCTNGPKEFVENFKSAKYVLTTSFHGTVFSIIFQKEFFVILPKQRSERIVSILQKLNLEDRIIEKESDIAKFKGSKIDYEFVENVLNEERKKAQDYFTKEII